MDDLLNVLPYALAFISRETDGHKEVLLIYRSHTSFGNDQYSMPGGKIQENESLRNGLIRELQEEIGITVQPTDMHLSHVMHFQGATRVCIAIVFTIKKWQGEPFNKEPDKHDHIAWFDINKLPSTLLPRHAKMIRSIEQGQLYSDEGLS